jgi:hypothetical protein
MNQTRAVSQTTFSKSPRLIEAASADPIRVMQKVFCCALIKNLREDILPKWLHAALINENSFYNNPDHRTSLIQFYDQNMLLTEAMQVISEQQDQMYKNGEAESATNKANHALLLTEEQIVNPLQVVIAFRQKFSVEYVRRELWHFLEAGVIHSGDFPNEFAPGYALMAYDFMSCVTEASFNLN